MKAWHKEPKHVEVDFRVSAPVSSFASHLHRQSPWKGCPIPHFHCKKGFALPWVDPILGLGCAKDIGIFPGETQGCEL